VSAETRILPGGKVKPAILLVDDDQTNLNVLTRRLEREGYVTRTATSGRAALEMLEVQRFDLVILDVYMPGMDGPDVLSHIKSDPRLQDTPVIMLSADDTRQIVKHCLLAGAADYLNKPLVIGLASQRIARCLRTSAGEFTRYNEPPFRHGETVLVVDDNDLSRDLIHGVIENIGYKPHTVAGGREALAAIEEQPFALALLDVRMPDVDGLEVLRQIRNSERHGALPIIMVSAEQDSRTIVKCIETGASDYVTKPFEPIFLRARIESCLRSRMSVDRLSLDIDHTGMGLG
jgi:CheY-like chemotaxis protein